MVHHDEVSLEGSQVLWVGIWWEDQAALHDDGIQDGRIIDIEEQVLTSWHSNRLSLDWWDVTTPGRWLRPQGHISVDQALSCDKTLTINSDSCQWSIWHVWLISSDANNLGGGSALNFAVTIIERNCGQCGDREILTSQGNGSATEDRAESWADGGELGSHGSSVGHVLKWD